MSKQTAVMYFINELKKSKHFQRVINEVNLSSTSVRDVIQETLQMEKEQIKEGYIMALLDGDVKIIRDAEDYYNEKYGETKN